MNKPQYIEPKANERGMNELHSACLYCNVASVKRCLKEGFNPNETDNNGFTPLIWLMRMYDSNTRERKRIFRSLIRNGGDISLQDTMGETALDHSKELSSSSFYNFVNSEYKRLKSDGRTEGSVHHTVRKIYL
jgi:ankyrin repeat protein